MIKLVSILVFGVLTFFVPIGTANNPDQVGIPVPELYMPEDGVFSTFTTHYDSVSVAMSKMGYKFIAAAKPSPESSLTLVRYEHPALDYSTMLIFAYDGSYVGFMIRRVANSSASYHAIKSRVFTVNAFINTTYTDYTRKNDEEFGIRKLLRPSEHGNCVVARCNMSDDDTFMVFIKSVVEQEIPEYNEGVEEYDNPRGDTTEPDEETSGVGRG